MSGMNFLTNSVKQDFVMTSVQGEDGSVQTMATPLPLMSPSQLDFEQSSILAPGYTFYRFDPRNNTQVSIGANSGAQTFIDVAMTGAYGNWSQAYLEGKIVVDNNDTDFTHFNTVGVPFIQYFRIGLRSGNVSLHQWQNGSLPLLSRGLGVACTSLEELRGNNTLTDDSDINLFTGNVRNNTTGANARLGGTAIDLPYEEIKYFVSSDVAASGESEVYFRIPLKSIVPKFSLMSLDLDLPLGLNWTVEIGWAPGIVTAFEGTAASNPTTGAKAMTKALEIQNIALHVPAQENKVIIDRLDEMFLRRPEGVTLNYPDVIFVAHPANSGSGRSIDVDVNLTAGTNVLYCGFIPYDGDAAANTTFDTTNIANAKLTKYNTFFAGEVLQKQVVDLSSDVYSDYKLLKQLFEGSALQSSSVYKNNWIHIDDFAGYGPLNKISTADLMRIVGIPVGSKLQKYRINLDAAKNLNVLVFFVVSRVLTLRPAPNGVDIMARVDNQAFT